MYYLMYYDYVFIVICGNNGKYRPGYSGHRVDVGVCATLTASLGARGPKKGRTAT